jgi:biopolymer transport protein ExbD
MRRYFLYLFAAILCFAIGIGANATINFVGAALVTDSEKVSDLTQATLFWEGPQLIPPRVSCGHVVVRVTAERKLFLGLKERGSLDDPGELAWALKQAFRVRTEMHVYRPGVEATSDMPEEQRIEKTVYIKAPRSLSYGELVDLIKVLEEAGATPIGLLPDAPFSKG